MYRTYFDTTTGAYLGSYDGPDEGNPHRGQPSVEGQVDAFHVLRDGAAVREVPVPSYRAQRKAAYIAELGDVPEFTEAVGDVLDDLIREVRALSMAPITPEFAVLANKIAAIKARYPQ